MKFIKKYYVFIILAILLGFHIFFLFYQMRERLVFGYDQVDNAWAAVRILIEHRYPLQGMMAKNNSGITIGPLYYYLVALFYAATSMDPIASPILAGVTAIIGFFVLWSITNKIFGRGVALWTQIIYVFSLQIIINSRVQWPVNFIPIMAYITFYCLYRVLLGEPKYLIALAVAVGLFFHIHFTAVFYPIIILATLPFFPWNRKTILYMIVSLPIFGIFFVPTFMSEITAITKYSSTYSHGFHLRRFLQLLHDPIISFEKFLPFPFMRQFLPFVFPLFAIVSFGKNRVRSWVLLCYIVALWILVPWILFTFFSGEITDYYFSGLQMIAAALLGYIFWWVYKRKFVVIKAVPFILLAYITLSTLQNFLRPSHTEYAKNVEEVRAAVNTKRKIEYSDGNPQSYLYYWMTLSPIHADKK